MESQEIYEITLQAFQKMTHLFKHGETLWRRFDSRKPADIQDIPGTVSVTARDRIPKP